MRVETSLGFSVNVDENGKFQLPDRKFTTSELKKVVREVNRHIRENTVENVLNEVFDNE